MSKVLIIEDNIDLRAVISMALKGEGYSVSCASNGEEGLRILKESARPSLILLDLMMPVMNGWEFLESKNGDPEISDIPTVICSATIPQDLGCAGFLKKPVDLDDLLLAVQTYCH